MMTLFILLSVQIALGALDNLMHHELTEKLPSRTSARAELALHGVRESIYAVLFLVLAWLAPHGLFAWALLGLLATEICITLADFVEEDRTRTLPPFERVLHTILALNFGAILAVGAPIWIGWRATPTALAPEAYGLFSWFLTLCALGVGAWGVRDCAASWMLFAKSAVKTTQPAPSGRTVLVTGATGFLGQDLVRRRLEAGDRVIVTSRDPKYANALFEGRVLAVADLATLPESIGIDAVINLAGAGVANAPWTPARRRELIASRLNATRALDALMQRLTQKPDVFLSASAVGYYGDRGDAVLSEAATAGDGFTSDLCTQWESAARLAGRNAKRTVLMRFGLILGRDGGAWPRMALPLVFKVAAQFGSGEQWMAWIHKQDALGLIEHALADGSVSGPVNAVAPQETRHGDVVRAMQDVRGAWLKIAAPAWALRLSLGDLSHLFLDSQRVLPRAAIAAGYAYRFPTIDAAASDLLGASRKRQPHATHAMR